MNHSSALGFSPRPPVSVYGTGCICLKLIGFSWKCLHCFASPEGYAQRTIPSVPSSYDSPSPNRNIYKRRNINLLSISYPNWVHLRPRLTLIRLALIRNPWSYGVRVSHPHYRYLCLHLLFQKLQQTLRFTFYAAGMLPYQSILL